MIVNSNHRILSPAFSAILGLLLATLTSVSFAQTDDSIDKIKTEQQQLAERYKQLEAKLFSLSEFEENSNPSRSKLLQKAFLQSQEKLTTVQLARAGKLINDGKYKDAEAMQTEALTSLTEMLKLLQAEDRAQQVRDDIDRYKEYLKEVDRLQRIQKGIRGQTEAGLDQIRLGKTERSAAERTAKLAEQIEADNNADSEADPDSDADSDSEADSDADSDSDSDADSDSDSDADASGEGDSEESEGKPSEGQPSEGQPSEGQPSEGQPSEGQPSEGQPSEGQPSEGQPSEGSEDGESEESDSVQDRIENAQQRMEDAAEALDQARRDDATEAMEAAEKELAEAKKELEEILRQLREEENDSNLKQLEDRFRGMLEQQTRVNEATDKLALTPSEARTTEFEISANRLAGDQNEIVTAAGRALLLLKEDGTSIAFPVTVEEMQQDMMQVSSRLSAAKVNDITQEIEADIVATLNELIEALVQEQEENEEEQQSQQQDSGGGSPGEQPLVDQIAELKMLSSLQKRIYKRHQRYAKYLDDPNDPVGVSQEPDVVVALDRLADRQAQLTDIARQLVNEQNE